MAGTATSSYLTVVFSDLERHTATWQLVPRERMVGLISEYRYLAESLAGQYGCLYREWAGDGHMFLFESADAATQFALKLIENWRIEGETLSSLKELPHLPLRIGCHFGECTRLEGEEAWIGRGNAIAKRVEAEAQPDALYVTESVVDLLDLPLYEFAEVGSVELKGDFLARRTLYRISSFSQAALNAKPAEELTAEEWFLKGVALIGTEREWTDEEAECYRQALKLRADYPEAHVNYAVLLHARGDDAGAMRHYHEALRIRPDYPEAHYNYAAMLGERGSIGGALEHYREALKHRPDYVDAHHGYATLLASRGDLEAAAEEYRETLRLRPEYAEARVNYAILLERGGDVTGGREQYERALDDRPENPATHYNYALFLEEQGDPLGAEHHYREALRHWADYGEAHNNLAILLQRRGDIESAERHYLAALDARPEDPEAHYNYALLLGSRGDEEAAKQHLRIAHELAPDVSVFRTAIERID
jgi:tetratricopeptide (TPR) repeat protein